MDGLVLVGLTLYTSVTCANNNLLLTSNHHLTAHECDYYPSYSLVIHSFTSLFQATYR
jgi:hypothetical protein